ncbi:hypothetical protein KIF59_07125 [Enterobacter cloacae subsp. cloacae]|nr:hypothetical protein [Enterobacter cloacae subsp. cloacae]
MKKSKTRCRTEQAGLADLARPTTLTIAVRKDVAEKGKLTSLAILSRYLKEKGDLQLGGLGGVYRASDALPAFEKPTTSRLTKAQLLSLAGGDTAVTIKAAAQQTSGVNAAMALRYGRPGRGAWSADLIDPKGVQPIYAPTPVVREAVLKAYPDIRRLA